MYGWDDSGPGNRKPAGSAPLSHVSKSRFHLVTDTYTGVPGSRCPQVSEVEGRCRQLIRRRLC